MSSTLFARGVNTQVGLRRRAEEVNKNIADVRAAVDEVKDLPRDFRVLRGRVDAVESNTVVIEKHTASLKELTEKVAAQQDTIAKLEEQLNKLVHMEGRLIALEQRVQGVVSRVDKLEAPAPAPAVVAVEEVKTD